MWPFKNKEANQDQAKTPVSPTMPPALPVAKFDPKINASFDLTRLAEYGRLAREVEYFPNEVVEQLFLHTLKKLGIKLFSLDEVRSYLSASYGREGYTGFWSWRSLWPRPWSKSLGRIRCANCKTTGRATKTTCASINHSPSG
jgi:hypothetical protein